MQPMDGFLHVGFRPDDAKVHQVELNFISDFLGFIHFFFNEDSTGLAGILGSYSWARAVGIRIQFRSVVCGSTCCTQGAWALGTGIGPLTYRY